MSKSLHFILKSLKTNYMILLKTLQNRIEVELNKSICHDFDVRYLDKWIGKFPYLFPKYIIDNNYTALFNIEKYRWEIVKGKKIIKFNAKNWINV